MRDVVARRVVGCVLAGFALAVPCVALAATVTVEGTRGDDLLVIRIQGQDGARVTVNGAPAAIAASGDAIEAATGAGNDTMIFDEVEDFERLSLRASLGGGHDTAVLGGVLGSAEQASGTSLSVDLGSGDDHLGLHNYGDTNRVRITGGSGNDRIRVSNNSASGASGAEVFTGGGPGNDYIDLHDPRVTRSDGGSGNDVIRTVDGGRDTIRCGAGADTAIADMTDSVGSDCETVRRSRGRSTRR